MDLAILGQNSIRVKGKSASIIVDPTDAIQKTEAEGLLFLSKDSSLKIERALFG